MPRNPAASPYTPQLLPKYRAVVDLIQKIKVVVDGLYADVVAPTLHPVHPKRKPARKKPKRSQRK
jgi:hypothetical protein